MDCDMVLALPSSGASQGFFAHTISRPADQRQSVVRIAARIPEAGEAALTSAGPIRQPLQTHEVLGIRSGVQWGLQAGCNEHGLVVGHRPVTNLQAECRRGLTGSDLVRLLLERSQSAEDAIGIAESLIDKHGIRGDDKTVLTITDAKSACRLTVKDHHQETEKIKVGESILSSLCFNSSPNHSSHTRQIPGPVERNDQIVIPLVRQMLAGRRSDSRHLFSMHRLDTIDQFTSSSTTTTLVVPLPFQKEESIPILWIGHGPASFPLYFPLFFFSDLPESLGCQGKIWRQIQQLQSIWENHPQEQQTLERDLEELQEHYESEVIDCQQEMKAFIGKGRHQEAQRHGNLFLQHCLERFDDLFQSSILHSQKHQPTSFFVHPLQH